MEKLKKFFKAHENEDCGLKYKDMFITVYDGGLRISELCNLRLQDIDSENMRVLV